MVSTAGKVLGTILRYVFGFTLGFDVVPEMVSLDGFFDGFNDVKFEGLLIGGSFAYTDGKVIASYEGTKLVSTEVKMFGSLPGDVYVITVRLDVETELGTLD